MTWALLPIYLGQSYAVHWSARQNGASWARSALVGVTWPWLATILAAAFLADVIGSWFGGGRR